MLPFFVKFNDVLFILVFSIAFCIPQLPSGFIFFGLKYNLALTMFFIFCIF